MFVDDVVELVLPPFPPPPLLDCDSSTAVFGTSWIIVSAPASVGTSAARKSAHANDATRLPNDLDMCPSPRVDCVRSALGARGPETYANCEGICHDKFAHTSTANLRKSLVIDESVDGLSEKKRTTGFEPATLSLGS